MRLHCLYPGAGCNEDAKAVARIRQAASQSASPGSGSDQSHGTRSATPTRIRKKLFLYVAWSKSTATCTHFGIYMMKQRICLWRPLHPSIGNILQPDSTFRVKVIFPWWHHGSVTKILGGVLRPIPAPWSVGLIVWGMTSNLTQGLRGGANECWFENWPPTLIVEFWAGAEEVKKDQVWHSPDLLVRWAANSSPLVKPELVVEYNWGNR